MWKACTQQAQPCVGGMQEASARNKARIVRAHLSKDVEGGQEEDQPNVCERHSHQRYFAWGVHLVDEQHNCLAAITFNIGSSRTNAMGRQDAHLLATRALGFFQATAGASGADNQQRAASVSEPDASLPQKRTCHSAAVPGCQLRRTGSAACEPPAPSPGAQQPSSVGAACREAARLCMTGHQAQRRSSHHGRTGTCPCMNVGR